MTRQPALENSTRAKPLPRPKLHSSSPQPPKTARLPIGVSRNGTAASNRPTGTLGSYSISSYKASRNSSEPYLPTETKATFQWLRGELLGQGSYGRVYMALNVNTGELMAVKQVEVQGDHKPAHQDALKFLAFENKTLRELDHQNVVQYLGYEASPEALSVFLEYVPGGTIATLLNKYGRFREEVTKSFTAQILNGLEYLHSCLIIHRDLKPDNILVEPIGVCKISDFGISKRVDDVNGPRAHTLMRGTFQYMAPEILGLKEKAYDGKIDIWSVGCMVMEMWTGEKPWGSGENFLSILMKLGQKQSPPPLPAQLLKELPGHAHKFRDLCFHINPVQRPPAGDLKQHPYLKLPPDWAFNENEIPHPSRERRVGVNGRRREHQDDGATYRLRNRPMESQDRTARPQDFQRGDHDSTVQTIEQPIPRIPPRGPSPPIVVIKPLPLNPVPAPSPSPVDIQERDNAPSESSKGSSHMSNKRKHRYIVVNPTGEEPSSSYRYEPPPLPAPQMYSAHLGASSKHNLDYIQEPKPTSRSRSASNPYCPSTHHPDPALSSSYPSNLLSTSKSGSSSSTPSLPQSSSSTEDSGTWKRLPTSAPFHRPAVPSSSKSRPGQGRSLSGSRSTSQLRTPPPPTGPPPLPPTRALPAPVPIRTPPVPSRPPPLPPPHSTSPSNAPTNSESNGEVSHRRGNRPNADDIVRRLGDYFPDHDLDRPVVVPSSSIEDFTENINSVNDHDFDDYNSSFGEANSLPVPSTSRGQPRTLQRVSNPFRTTKYSTLPSHGAKHASGADWSRGGRSGRASPFDGTAASSLIPVFDEDSGRLEHTKSIRKIAEELAYKRQSNPGKARRRTLWDVNMEELKKIPPSP